MRATHTVTPPHYLILHCNKPRSARPAIGVVKEMANAEIGTEAGQQPVPVDHTGHPPQRLSVLTLGALGVVYGDIGTSPIYAFREALVASAGGQTASREDILGVLSLIIWALTIIVTIKYIMFVLRADNKGEGGTLSLMALARSSFKSRPASILIIGMLGASLFYGDAVITPAISVLSAVEGLKTVTPSFDPYVVPITIVILVGLFAVQRFGTGSVGIVFGPTTLVWFLAIGASGLDHIFDDPTILYAINPYYIVGFLTHQPDVAFVTIGAIFLAVTGAEALYADLGHFGRKPIVLAWLSVVFPCLLLNYVGQGAFVLSHQGAIGHPFFEMNRGWALIPMVVLATCATVIASQAVISGAYSLTRQAVQLNLLPRFNILHTSETQSGQIYMPRVNFLLAIVVLLLVLGFEESSDLAAAYGISVTGNMLMTTLLLYAYCLGNYSSRRIAKACEQRVDFMSVTAMNRPDFRTISDFRKRHLAALGQLFGQVLKLCARAGLVKLGHVALDGTKLKANASRHKAMSYKRMKESEARLAAEVASWLEQAEATDAAEDEQYGEGRRGDELPDWVANKQRRLG